MMVSTVTQTVVDAGKKAMGKTEQSLPIIRLVHAIKHAIPLIFDTVHPQLSESRLSKPQNTLL